MKPTKGCNKDFSTLPEFNPKVVLKDIMFAPVETDKDVNRCFKYFDSKNDTSRSVDNLWKLCGDGHCKSIKRCKSSLCKLRKDFFPSDRVVSSSTQRVYDVICPPGTMNLSCNSTNLVYLLTCTKCSLQYVGETIQGLNQRFSEHRQGIENSSAKSGCKILSEHFNSGHCKGAEYKVRILEKMCGSGRTERGAIDLNARRIRLKRERHWMLKLRTVYPFGLNAKIGDEFLRDDDDECISPKFPKLARQFVQGTKGSHLKQHKMSAESFLNQLDTILNTNIKEAMNFLRTCLHSLSKKVLKNIYMLIDNIIHDRDSNFFIQWYLAVHDIIVSKLYYIEPLKLNKKPTLVLNVNFVNKGVEMINLPKLLNLPILSASFPSDLPCIEKYTAPTVVYKLGDTIHSKLFNYKVFIKDLNLNEFLNNPNSLSCECSESVFKDNYHNHIVSGDLSIVKDLKLKELFQKGPQYREPVTINFEDSRKEIASSVKTLTKKWSNKYKVNEALFDAWQISFNDILNKRIKDLQESVVIKPFYPLLQKHSIIKQLEVLHSKFVITPIDKASNNVAFICKRHYAQVLVDELGLENTNDSAPTYIKITNMNIEQIVKKHDEYVKKLFKTSIEDKCLPNMHWTPKMHKIPSKARFIVAAKYCSLKGLAQAVTKVLKMFYKQVENYSRKSYFFSHVKTFWVIKNKDPVIKTLKRLNDRKCAQSVSTYDFSTLYTKIPHPELKNVLNEITDFCFNGCNDSKISIAKMELAGLMILNLRKE